MVLDMDLKPVQVCRTTDGWSPVQVDSASSPGNKYTVLVSPFVPVKEFVCGCKGFEIRGYCRHQRESLSLVCWWPLGMYQEAQSQEDKRNKICPHCGGPTKWEMVDAEETQA
jgi:hypothetical protein